ncbi:hypothetical protein [Chengkuizengella sediminis]|uniref:hypothetical protein n=1 Tax=Chengkuizengella sediminis TaxID=1885917 RepID=UPI00138A21A9|nr:hypothetical protein [Chengkuizengella sediminis]NDI34602.1 hypothetical protein [Chengkuizengella sediminis]
MNNKMSRKLLIALLTFTMVFSSVSPVFAHESDLDDETHNLLHLFEPNIPSPSFPYCGQEPPGYDGPCEWFVSPFPIPFPPLPQPPSPIIPIPSPEPPLPLPF